MKTQRTIGLVPQVKARAVCIGGPLNGKFFMVGIGDGLAFRPNHPDWAEHGEFYRCEYLSIDRFHYHIIIHDSLSTVAAVGQLLEHYQP